MRDLSRTQADARDVPGLRSLETCFTCKYAEGWEDSSIWCTRFKFYGRAYWICDDHSRDVEETAG